MPRLSLTLSRLSLAWLLVLAPNVQAQQPGSVIPDNAPSSQQISLQAAQAEANTLRQQLEAALTGIAQLEQQISQLTALYVVARRVGRGFKLCTDCPELVQLPSGSYRRGSPDTETGRSTDEGPVRTVRIDYPLAAGKYAVTFAEWDACVRDGGCAYKPDDQDWGRDRRPVINISWNNIQQQYLPWLNRKAKDQLPPGQVFRLPTESEREYLARGITDPQAPHPPFPALPGSRWVDGQCPHTDAYNYAGYLLDYADCGAKTGTYRQQTVPVDFFPQANAFGLYQMAGNVQEWTIDCYHYSYAQTPDDGRPAAEEADCGRIVRGGSSFSFPRSLRAAERNYTSPDARKFHIGFRVVLSRMLP